MPEWLVMLVGRERDLRFLASAVREHWRITEEDGKFYLGSSRFEALSDTGKIQSLADEFLDWAGLHALLRFEGYQGVQIAEIVGRNPNGSRHARIVLMTGHAEGRSTASGVMTLVGSPVKPRAPSLTRDVSVLRRHPSLEKALRYVQEEPGWRGYWRATEALGENIGGLKNIVGHGWATEEEWKRFEDTVHHRRHHWKPAPPNPMSEGEVRSRLLNWLRRCIDWRLSEGK